VLLGGGGGGEGGVEGGGGGTHKSNMRMLSPAFFGTSVASCTSNCIHR